MSVDLFSDQAKGLLAAGVDEVGRGPLIGDVVAGAVILDPNNPIEGLADSKKLSEKRREALYTEIVEKSLAWGIGRASPAEIDEINILQASMLAMTRAVEALKVQPEFVWVDGNRCPKWAYASEAVVKGDSKIAEISAGSIIAKVTRDREMHALHLLHPEYGFDGHKGYPTAKHMKALEDYGVLAEHRRTFNPVRKIIEQSSSS
jgi:ribonuclease HII